jgi:hypothetical protein
VFAHLVAEALLSTIGRVRGDLTKLRAGHLSGSSPWWVAATTWSAQTALVLSGLRGLILIRDPRSDVVVVAGAT